LLAGKYQLFDIDDVEAMCVKAARRWCEKTQTRLSHHDFQDLVSFLIVSLENKRTLRPAAQPELQGGRARDLVEPLHRLDAPA
jgi:hypothetical protein